MRWVWSCFLALKHIGQTALSMRGPLSSINWWRWWDLNLRPWAIIVRMGPRSRRLAAIAGLGSR